MRFVYIYTALNYYALSFICIGSVAGIFLFLFYLHAHAAQDEFNFCARIEQATEKTFDLEQLKIPYCISGGRGGKISPGGKQPYICHENNLTTILTIDYYKFILVVLEKRWHSSQRYGLNLVNT
ncbi:hypothetical protein ACJX0J_005734, partial [Zea mays]